MKNISFLAVVICMAVFISALCGCTVREGTPVKPAEATASPAAAEPSPTIQVILDPSDPMPEVNLPAEELTQEDLEALGVFTPAPEQGQAEPTAVPEQGQPEPTAVPEQGQPEPTAAPEQGQPEPTAAPEQEQPVPTGTPDAPGTPAPEEPTVVAEEPPVVPTYGGSDTELPEA